jgi:hypothetical protein
MAARHVGLMLYVGTAAAAFNTKLELTKSGAKASSETPFEGGAEFSKHPPTRACCGVSSAGRQERDLLGREQLIA